MGGEEMANIKSAKKRILITQKKALQNKRRKSDLKTAIKKFEALLYEKKLEEAETMLKLVEKKLNRAQLHNVLHKNTASRKLSKLRLKLNKAN